MLLHAGVFSYCAERCSHRRPARPMMTQASSLAPKLVPVSSIEMGFINGSFGNLNRHRTLTGTGLSPCEKVILPQQRCHHLLHPRPAPFDHKALAPSLENCKAVALADGPHGLRSLARGRPNEAHLSKKATDLHNLSDLKT